MKLYCPFCRLELEHVKNWCDYDEFFDCFEVFDEYVCKGCGNEFVVRRYEDDENWLTIEVVKK